MCILISDDDSINGWFVIAVRRLPYCSHPISGRLTIPQAPSLCWTYKRLLEQGSAASFNPHTNFLKAPPVPWNSIEVKEYRWGVENYKLLFVPFHPYSLFSFSICKIVWNNNILIMYEFIHYTNSTNCFLNRTYVCMKIYLKYISILCSMLLT